VAEESRPWRLLFVCTGNICRSPMAEGLALRAAADRGRDIEVASCGTHDLDGAPADKHAVAVCAEIGVDLGAHASRQVDAELVAWADYILVMEYAHVEAVRDEFPDARERLMLLGTLGGTMEIADPYGGWRYQFRRSRDEIKRCVEAFVDRLPARKELR
jgi:protein-tyrosine-phosphatase